MAKSLLNLYLQRVSEGEEGYTDRLLSQLAERLVYVPVERNKGGEADTITVNAIRIKEAHRSVVPIFTSEIQLKDWSAAQGFLTPSISLFGADLVMALPEEAWVVVNPGSEAPVELQPSVLDKLRDIGESQSADDEPVELDPLSELADPYDVPVPEEAPIAEPVSEAPVAAPLEEHPVHDEVAEDEPVQSRPQRKGKSFLDFLKLS